MYTHTYISLSLYIYIYTHTYISAGEVQGKTSFRGLQSTVGVAIIVNK